MFPEDPVGASPNLQPHLKGRGGLSLATELLLITNQTLIAPLVSMRDKTVASSQEAVVLDDQVKYCKRHRSKFRSDAIFSLSAFFVRSYRVFLGTVLAPLRV